MTENNSTIHPGWLPTAKFLKFLDTLEPTPRHAKVLADREKERKAQASAAQAEREAAWAVARDAALDAEPRVRGRVGPYQPREKHVVTGRVHYMEDDIKYRAWR